MDFFSDPAMKQFLLYLDEKLELGFRFIIKNLDDDTHLFISPESVTILQQRIDTLMEKLSPDLGEKWSGYVICDCDSYFDNMRVTNKIIAVVACGFFAEKMLNW